MAAFLLENTCLQ
jgi:hypothetical protein